ncbi:hypothetical protein HDU78_000791, partial [Chytriomyces hyalinus]
MTIARWDHFGAVLDELYLQCNSCNSIDMLAEWDQSWETTVGEFPINRKLWYELRSWHFTINKGCMPEVDAALAVKFKRRILEVVPSFDVKPVKAMIMGQTSRKQAANDLDLRDKKLPKMALYCSHHKGNNSHPTEDFPDTLDEHMLVDTPSK